MELPADPDARMMVYAWATLIVGVALITIFRCWRAYAQIVRWRHLREMEAFDKQIALEKAKHAPVQPTVAAAPVSPPVVAPAPAPKTSVKPPTAEPLFAIDLDLDQEPPCSRKA